MSATREIRVGPCVLSPDVLQKRKVYLEIGPQDEQRLREAGRRLSTRESDIVERFYDFLLSHEHTRRLLAAPGLVEKLKEIQRRYFVELTSGSYDLEYFENRLHVGLAHERAGLSPEWYLGAYQKYLGIVSGVLQESFGADRDEFHKTLVSLTKIIFLDMSLAIDAYILSGQAQLARKAAELEEANAELRRLDAAKRHLTGAIIHDLQNPLAGIIAFLQVLEARPQGLTETERSLLAEAMARCRDLSTMIMEVLHMNRAEEGKLDLYIESMDLAELARSAVEAFALVAQQGSRRLKFVADGGPVSVRTDQSLLRRILYNLIRNALQHTPAGTRVEVRLRVGPPWVLSVIDTGPGIPEEIQSRIFEPGALRSAGYQVQSGVGLVFSKMAAEALGLRLWLAGGPERGTCFCLQPAAGAPGQALPVQPALE